MYEWQILYINIYSVSKNIGDCICIHTYVFYICTHIYIKYSYLFIYFEKVKWLAQSLTFNK